MDPIHQSCPTVSSVCSCLPNFLGLIRWLLPPSLVFRLPLSLTLAPSISFRFLLFFHIALAFVFCAMEGKKASKAKRLRTSHMDAMLASLPLIQIRTNTSAAQPNTSATQADVSPRCLNPAAPQTLLAATPARPNPTDPAITLRLANTSAPTARSAAFPAAVSAAQAAISAAQSNVSLRSVNPAASLARSAAQAAMSTDQGRSSISQPESSTTQAESSGVMIPRAVFEVHKTTLAGIGIFEGMPTPPDRSTRPQY